MKLEILKESSGYRGNHFEEDYALSKFVRGFYKDVEYYGESAVGLYKTLFGIDKQIDFLYNNREEINENIKNVTSLCLFEKVIERGMNQYLTERMDDGHPNKKATFIGRDDINTKRILSADEINGNYDVKKWSDEYVRNKIDSLPNAPREDDYARAKKAKDALKMSRAGREDFTGTAEPGENIVDNPTNTQEDYINPKKLKDALTGMSKARREEFTGDLETAVESEDPLKVEKAIQTLSVGNSVIPVKAGGEIASVAKPVAAQGGFFASILKNIQSAWGSIKGFFTGQFDSIGHAMEAGGGGFQEIMKLPLAQGVAGIAGLALARKAFQIIAQKRKKGK